jgi:hypothetical protein
VSTDQAAQYVTIRVGQGLLSDKSITNGVLLEGLLVHEGKHAFDIARTVQSLSAREGADKFYDPTNFQREYSSFTTEAAYYLYRGNAYVDVGLATDSGNLLKQSGNGIKVNEQRIRDALRATYNLTPERPGLKVTEKFGLRPPP